MSEYGSIDDINRKIRDNVLKTEPKDASKNPLWQNFVAFLKKWMPRRSSFRSSPALSAAACCLTTVPNIKSFYVGWPTYICHDF